MENTQSRQFTSIWSCCLCDHLTGNVHATQYSSKVTHEDNHKRGHELQGQAIARQQLARRSTTAGFILKNIGGLRE